MRDISKSNPELLAKMLDLSGCLKRVWRPEELGAMLRHQMAAAVQFDLGNLDPSIKNKLSRLSDAEGLLVKSFGELFDHPQPPVELLILTKQFAKASRMHPDSPLPAEISALLYLMSITVAMTRCGERITELDDESLVRGIEQTLAQSWVDEKSREILKQGIDLLKLRQGEQHDR